MTEHWSPDEYRKHLEKSAGGGNKFFAKKTVVDGRNFDSLKEAADDADFVMQAQAGEIVSHIPQVSIPISPNSKIRSRIDSLVIFEVFPDGSFHGKFVDSKAIDKKTGKFRVTPEARVKYDAILHSYGIVIEFR